MLGLRQPPARGCMSAGTQSGEECLDTESDSDQDIPPPPRDDRVMDNSDAVAKSRITSADSSEDHDDEGTSSNAKAPVSRKRKTERRQGPMDACK